MKLHGAETFYEKIYANAKWLKDYYANNPGDIEKSRKTANIP